VHAMAKNEGGTQSRERGERVSEVTNLLMEKMICLVGRQGFSL